MHNTVKFIHTGDLHLGTAFKSVPRDTSDGKTLLQATYETCRSITDLAIAEEVDFVIYAGDIFDNPREMFVARSKFIQEMKRLEAAGIGAYVIYGNHDSLSEQESRLPYPDNVVEFTGAAPEVHTFENSSGSCFIAGQSYLTKNVPDNLAKGFPLAPLHQNSVAILHTDLGSEGSSHYAPCSVQDLKNLNYAYYALGHTHNGGVKETNPVIAYCTSPQALDINEGGRHGVWIVELQDGKVVSHEHYSTGVIEFQVLDVDVTGCDSVDEVHSRAVSAVTGLLDDASKSTVIRLRYKGLLSLEVSEWTRIYHTNLHEGLESVLEHHPKGKTMRFWLDSAIMDNTTAEISYEELIRSNGFAETLYEVAQADAAGFITGEARSLIDQALAYVVDEASESDEDYCMDLDALQKRALDLVFSQLFAGSE